MQLLPHDGIICHNIESIILLVILNLVNLDFYHQDIILLSSSSLYMISLLISKKLRFAIIIILTVQRKTIFNLNSIF
jgi:hypothetical protein